MASRPGYLDNARRCARVVVATCMVGAMAVSGAQAGVKEAVLHSFSGSDGATPNGIMIDASGTIFGTTSIGGANGGGSSGGVVFALVPNGTDYDYSVLYNFCAQANCADGSLPVAQPLVEDTSGNLYGVTQGGGKFGDGTAFELVSDDGSWSLVTLYSFCRKSGCKDGRVPVAGLTYQGAQSGELYDGTSPLYGTTANGGSSFDMGVVYALTFVQGQQARDQQVLYTFCKIQFCPDGQNPSGGLIVDSQGRLYGNALEGGECCSGFGGVTYRLAFNATTNKWKYGLLYNLGSGSSGDGRNPVGSLVMNSRGHLLGVTENGGTFANGTVFELVPKGKNSTESVLYSFCTDQNTCTDGSEPGGGLVPGSKGKLFGTTSSGGLGFDDGVLFELSGGTETVLYEFCKLSGCTDGRVPEGNLVRDSSGNIFGVTQTGGNVGDGVVFKITGTH